MRNNEGLRDAIMAELEQLYGAQNAVMERRPGTSAVKYRIQLPATKHALEPKVFFDRFTDALQHIYKAGLPVKAVSTLQGPGVGGVSPFRHPHNSAGTYTGMSFGACLASGQLV